MSVPCKYAKESEYLASKLENLADDLKMAHEGIERIELAQVSFRESVEEKIGHLEILIKKIMEKIG